MITNWTWNTELIKFYLIAMEKKKGKLKQTMHDRSFKLWKLKLHKRKLRFMNNKQHLWENIFNYITLKTEITYLYKIKKQWMIWTGESIVAEGPSQEQWSQASRIFQSQNQNWNRDRAAFYIIKNGFLQYSSSPDL